MVLIVGVRLVVGVDVLLLQGRWRHWRRRGVRSLHPWREEWSRNPGGDAHILTFRLQTHFQIDSQITAAILVIIPL